MIDGRVNLRLYMGGGAGISMSDVQQALSALGWWRDAGVDTIVDDVPRDWLRPSDQVAAAPLATATPAEPAILTASFTPAVPSSPAAAPATRPATLAAFADWCADPLNLAVLGPARVAASGDVASGLMILVDMPEADDADAGHLLSGPLERLFDRILGAIGRDRGAVYLAALCPARPASGRVTGALAIELAALARQHVALARPRLLLLMGQAATEAFDLSWPTARGSSHKIHHDGGMTTAIATFHPRMLLQSPARKADLWADLRLLIEEFDR